MNGLCEQYHRWRYYNDEDDEMSHDLLPICSEQVCQMRGRKAHWKTEYMKPREIP